MSVHKMDELHVQVLKVSGADKIETAVDLTDQVLALDGLTAANVAAANAIPAAMSTVLTAADEAVIEDLGAMTEVQSTALATVPGATHDVIAAADAAVIEDLGAMTEVQSTALATVPGPVLDDVAIALTGYSMTKATGGANICNVTISPIDSAAAAITGVRNLEVWFSDASTGAGLASTWVLDTVTASTGTILNTLTSVTHYIVQTDANGVVVLVLTDAAKAAGYVCITNPLNGVSQTLEIVATTDYGA